MDKTQSDDHRDAAVAEPGRPFTYAELDDPAEQAFVNKFAPRRAADRHTTSARAEVIAEYMRQRGRLTERMIELNGSVQWNHYHVALTGLIEEMQRIDAAVASLLAVQEHPGTALASTDHPARFDAATDHQRQGPSTGEACCPDWEPGCVAINAPIILRTARSGGAWQYNFRPFAFCPWCGAKKPAPDEKPSDAGGFVPVQGW